MRSKEELTALKEEVEAMKQKLSELTAKELEAVTGGGECYALVWSEDDNFEQN